MRSKSGSQSAAEAHFREIRRSTRKNHSAEARIRIVREGLRGECLIADLSRKEDFNQNFNCRRSTELLEGRTRGRACEIG